MQIEGNKYGLKKISLKISKLLNLEMGKCFVGFIQNSINSNYTIDIFDWRMTGNSVFNSNDSWNGLTLDYNFQ